MAAELELAPQQLRRLLGKAAVGPPPAPALRLDRLRAFEISLELLAEERRELLAPDAQGRLVVELEGAVVEVDRSDRGSGAVDHHRLRLQHRRLELGQFDPLRRRRCLLAQALESPSTPGDR